LKRVFEHEIPNGAKLYFGESASKKRHIESVASSVLTARGFSEIVTPIFTYERFSTAMSPIRISDAANNELFLRYDSTEDAVRIIRKRLKDSGKKWFYIQPVFSFPTNECYQIGVEILESDELATCLLLSTEIFEKLNLTPTVQLSNIQIPRIICKLLDLDISLFENGEIGKILSLNLTWLNRLALLKDANDLNEVVALVPNELKAPLEALANLSSSVKCHAVFAPLYYSKMHYYESLFFRFLSGNSVLCSGGSYEIDGQNATGFAIFTDELLKG